MTTQTSAPAFQLKVERNLVVVRVIVRDSQGRARDDLTKDDFLLSDDRKPQTISHFSIEKAAAGPVPLATANGEKPEAGGAAVSAPRRFLALYFDDVHLNIQDVMAVRIAAAHSSSLQRGSRPPCWSSRSGSTVASASSRRRPRSACASPPASTACFIASTARA